MATEGMSRNRKILLGIVAVLIIIVGGCFILGGIGLKKDASDNTDYSMEEKLIKYKTEYVGDNSKVGGILNNLDYPEGFKYSGMRLLTNEKPYGIVVEVDASRAKALNASGKNISAADAIDLDAFERNAHRLFSLIGNLDHVTFFFDTNSDASENSQKLKQQEFAAATYVRSELEKSLGGNSYSDFSKNPKQLSKFRDIALQGPFTRLQDWDMLSASDDTHSKVFKSSDIKKAKQDLKNEIGSKDNLILKRLWFNDDYAITARDQYMNHGMGSALGDNPADVIVLLADIEFVSEIDADMAFEGEKKNWTFFLVREKETGVWHIADQGY